MNRILLVTSPKYDDGTEYLSHYASLVLKKAESLGILNKNFDGKNATHKNVSKFITKKDPKLLFINGHGNERSLEGNRGEILFDVDKDINLLRDRLVYARACHAGLLLGKKAVENNNGCFIGYKSPFSFWIDDKRSATPLKDKIAALFLEPSNDVVNSLLKRKTARESDRLSKEKMIENMNKILKMKERKEPGAMGWLGILWNNYAGQKLHGNGELVF